MTNYTICSLARDGDERLAIICKGDTITKFPVDRCTLPHLSFLQFVNVVLPTNGLNVEIIKKAIVAISESRSNGLDDQLQLHGLFITMLLLILIITVIISELELPRLTDYNSLIDIGRMPFQTDEGKARDDSDNLCTVCLGYIIPETEYQRTKICNHSFHPLCLQTWLAYPSGSLTCPQCTRVLQPDGQRKCPRRIDWRAMPVWLWSCVGVRATIHLFLVMALGRTFIAVGLWNWFCSWFFGFGAMFTVPFTIILDIEARERARGSRHWEAMGLEQGDWWGLMKLAVVKDCGYMVSHVKGLKQRIAGHDMQTVEETEANTGLADQGRGNPRADL